MNESNATGASPGAAAAAPDRVEFPFEFRGQGGEYFRIWIVNLLLSIVTLGIYSAWAKVRRMRYFYGNTFVEGHSFEYHGQPLAILKGRLIVFGAYVLFLVASQIVPLLIFLLIPLIILGVPWIIMRSRMFQMRMTSYRNLRFNFHGTYSGALGAFIGWYLLAVITLGILFPLWVKKRVEYSLANASYGRERFRFMTSTGTFYKFCLATFGLSILAYAAFIVFAISSGFMGEVGSTRVPGTRVNPADLFDLLGIGGFLCLVAFGIVALGIMGYYQSSFMNASFGGVEVGQLVVRSRLRTWPLIWIYVTNFLGVLCTLGLFYPWAKIRQIRYHLENTAVNAPGTVAGFTAEASQGVDAIGEEIGDFFDVDFGL
jgi:uncharacterized membrane protein YjgN (DUF898 family)